jgi:hypothetical protein
MNTFSKYASNVKSGTKKTSQSKVTIMNEGSNVKTHHFEGCEKPRHDPDDEVESCLEPLELLVKELEPI